MSTFGSLATIAVVETITLKLNDGATAEQFTAANSQVESEFIPAQPGYIAGSRRTSLAEDGTWTITLRWDNAADVDASMAGFMDAPATQDYLARVDVDSLTMARSVEGFVEFFEPFIERNSDRNIEIVRGIVDGRFVFLQAAQVLNGGESKWVTTDLFDTDANEKIIEHRDNVESLPPADELMNSGKF